MGRTWPGAVGAALLDSVGDRYTADELRLRLVNPKALNPQTVMPAYYKAEGLYQVLKRYRDKPILTAQEIEDIIAYLLTLRKDTPHVADCVKTKLTLPRNPPQESSAYSVEDRRSGYTYLSEENKQLQDDEFGNPGMLWVERGRELWEQIQGTSQQSCVNCHADDITTQT